MSSGFCILYIKKCIFYFISIRRWSVPFFTHQNKNNINIFFVVSGVQLKSEQDNECIHGFVLATNNVTNAIFALYSASSSSSSCCKKYFTILHSLQSNCNCIQQPAWKWILFLTIIAFQLNRTLIWIEGVYPLIWGRYEISSRYVQQWILCICASSLNTLRIFIIEKYENIWTIITVSMIDQSTS